MSNFYLALDGSKNIRAKIRTTQQMSRFKNVTKTQYESVPDILREENRKPLYQWKSSSLVTISLNTVYPLGDLKIEKIKELRINRDGKINETDRAVIDYREAIENGDTPEITASVYFRLLADRKAIRDSETAIKSTINSKGSHAAVRAINIQL